MISPTIDINNLNQFIDRYQKYLTMFDDQTIQYSVHYNDITLAMIEQRRKYKV